MTDEDAEVIIVGDGKAKAWLREAPVRVHDWLYELVDATVFFASDRIQAHAPGGIDQLVSVDVPNVLSEIQIEGAAGVEPDLTLETFGRGLGSDPADYPVYVEVGTGVFGETGQPITSLPGYAMGPIIGSDGNFFFTTVVQGQPAQHYTEHAYEDTLAWLPAVITERLPELGRGADSG